MRDVAIVSFAQRQERAIPNESEVEFMVPLMSATKEAVGPHPAGHGGSRVRDRPTSSPDRRSPS